MISCGWCSAWSGAGGTQHLCAPLMAGASSPDTRPRNERKGEPSPDCDYVSLFALLRRLGARSGDVGGDVSRGRLLYALCREGVPSGEAKRQVDYNLFSGSDSEREAGLSLPAAAVSVGGRVPRSLWI